MAKKEDASIRFWRKVQKSQNENECWMWLAAKDRYGYGRFNNGNFETGAHRFSYQEFFGPLDRKTEVDHLCRTKLCVNPKHLEAVSHEENYSRYLNHYRQNPEKYFRGQLRIKRQFERKSRPKLGRVRHKIPQWLHRRWSADRDYESGFYVYPS